MEGAAIAVEHTNGEVRAVVGSTQPYSYGFNRSINAIRPIGSLVKPYLSYRPKHEDYTLTTILDDSKFSMVSGGKIWEPDNFDKKFHGQFHSTLLYGKSYNIASARLGLDIGFEAGRNVLKLRYSEGGEIILLFIGSFELSPYQAIQAYQTIVADGFYSP